MGPGILEPTVRYFVYIISIGRVFVYKDEYGRRAFRGKRILLGFSRQKVDIIPAS
jgi:hypothetical protein